MTNLLPVVKQRVHAASGLSGVVGAARVDRSVEEPGRPLGASRAASETAQPAALPTTGGVTYDERLQRMGLSRISYSTVSASNSWAPIV
jgi:hypothetical protein